MDGGSPSVGSGTNRFVEMAKINVNAHVEKKNNLSYLSWAWAVDQLLRVDPLASWSYSEPVRCGGDTMMVVCTVTAFGMPRTMQLPVMDHRNKPIANPDAFQINTAMQRCLVKAIALHGLGLYIYAGEDLPEGEQAAPPELDNAIVAQFEAAASMDALAGLWNGIAKKDRPLYAKLKDDAKKRLQPALAEQA